MMISGVYKIKCVENNKVYIGMSSNIKRRWKDHKRYTNARLKKDMDLYGIDKFEFSIIEKNNDLEELKKLENHYIVLYSSHLDSKGYNTIWRDANNPNKKIKNEHDQRVAFDVDKNLWKQVGIEAAKNDTTRRNIVEIALKEYLKKEN